MASDTESDLPLDLFQEPSDFRAPPPPRRISAHYDLPTCFSPSGAASSSSSRRIDLQLVGFSPLWGHHLWNAAPALSDYLLRYRAQLLAPPAPGARVCVLELGAASGLPSVVAAKFGGYLPASHSGTGVNSSAQHAAPFVVSTDYPDEDLIACLRENLATNGVLLTEEGKDASVSSPETERQERGNAVAMGYIWGSDPSALLSRIKDIPSASSSASAPHFELKQEQKQQQRKFDLLLLSDLVFNHQAHDALLDTCEMCLSGAFSPFSSTSKSHTDEAKRREAKEADDTLPDPDPVAMYPPVSSDATEFEHYPSPALPSVLVIYTHHRPHLSHKDLRFFAKARRRGWTCDVVLRRKKDVMFPEDDGDEAVRGTIWGWRMTRTTNKGGEEGGN